LLYVSHVSEIIIVAVCFTMCFRAWATEPTDTHHAENCVTMDSAGALSDDDCDLRMGYLCSFAPNATGILLKNDKICGFVYHLHSPTGWL
jgi:hypothetical protein